MVEINVNPQGMREAGQSTEEARVKAENALNRLTELMSQARGAIGEDDLGAEFWNGDGEQPGVGTYMADVNTGMRSLTDSCGSIRDSFQQGADLYAGTEADSTHDFHT